MTDKIEQKARSQDIVFKGKWNIRYLILWFMVAIYPLIVIPYQLPRDLEIIAPVSYFYAPRYVVLLWDFFSFLQCSPQS
jgi:hypothetical protein